MVCSILFGEFSLKPSWTQLPFFQFCSECRIVSSPFGTCLKKRWPFSGFWPFLRAFASFQGIAFYFFLLLALLATSTQVLSPLSFSSLSSSSFTAGTAGGFAPALGLAPLGCCGPVLQLCAVGLFGQAPHLRMAGTFPQWWCSCCYLFALFQGYVCPSHWLLLANINIEPTNQTLTCTGVLLQLAVAEEHLRKYGKIASAITFTVTLPGLWGLKAVSQTHSCRQTHSHSHLTQEKYTYTTKQPNKNTTKTWNTLSLVARRDMSMSTAAGCSAVVAGTATPPLASTLLLSLSVCPPPSFPFLFLFSAVFQTCVAPLQPASAGHILLGFWVDWLPVGLEAFSFPQLSYWWGSSLAHPFAFPNLLSSTHSTPHFSTIFFSSHPPLQPLSSHSSSLQSQPPGCQFVIPGLLLLASLAGLGAGLGGGDGLL